MPLISLLILFKEIEIEIVGASNSLFKYAFTERGFSETI